MCILVHQPAGLNLSRELILDFIDYNPDGFGAMFANDGKIEVVKTLAKAEEIIQIYNEVIAGKEAIIHLRMKTHGDIDLDNCHPYRITDDIWLAHNGILSEGNPVIKAKSDTWHYIEYVLRPILEARPELFEDPDFIEYLGVMIGSSNKFGMLRSDGMVQVVNRDEGVEHQDIWFSNTYAWSPEKFGYKPKYPKYSSNYGYGAGYGTARGPGWMYGDDEYDEPYYGYGYNGSAQKGVCPSDVDTDDDKFTITQKQMDKITKAAYNSWRRDTLTDWVLAAPEKARHFLAEWYQDQTGEISAMVDYDPDSAAAWIGDLFESDSVRESDLRSAGVIN